MVVFTCNHCGESLKKQAVEKHYTTTKCRSAGGIFVSCMDCMKDFKDREFDAHIKCISEAEKYSGKDYVPKPSQNKGAKKQEAWLDLVRTIQNSSSVISQGAKKILELIAKHDNIPRKKAPFIRYLQNSYRFLKMPEIEETWGLLEEEMKKNKPASNNPPPKAMQNGDSEEKKRKLDEVESTAAEEQPKKKKKKKSEQNGDAEVTLDQAPSTEDATDEPPKKKKKKKVEENGEENAEAAQPEVPATETDEPPKKKKKKSKPEQNGDADVATNGVQNEENGQEAPEQENGTTPEGKFIWTHVIRDIVRDKGNQIKMKKLKKKAIEKYKHFYGSAEEMGEKIERKFNKTLKKCGLVIDQEYVRLVE